MFFLSAIYGISNKVSTYGDVYNYEILSLAMFTRSSIEESFEEEFNLHSFVTLLWQDFQSLGFKWPKSHSTKWRNRGDQSLPQE